MAITEQITCDGCGKVKQKVNHWWIMTVFQDEVRVHRWHSKIVKRIVNFGKHYCGQECLGKAVSAWMATASTKP